jgi:Lrp/AsnC family transcriptional regulator for asnA, asnC and gidA
VSTKSASEPNPSPRESGDTTQAEPAAGVEAKAVGRITLDDLDHAILEILQRDGRMPNTDVGRALSVTETTVRNRISRLIKSGVMVVVAVVDPAALGMDLASIIGLSVEPKYISSVAAAFVNLPEVRYLGISTGRYDVIIEGVFADRQHLMRFITEVVASAEGVRAVETSLMLNVPKRAFMSWSQSDVAPVATE